MILSRVTNIPAFFRCISKCSGDVSFIDESGSARDLKQIAAHGDVLASLIASGQLRDLEIHAAALEDRLRLIRFMHEMHVR